MFGDFLFNQHYHEHFLKFIVISNIYNNVLDKVMLMGLNIRVCFNVVVFVVSEE